MLRMDQSTNVESTLEQIPGGAQRPLSAITIRTDPAHRRSL